MKYFKIIFGAVVIKELETLRWNIVVHMIHTPFSEVLLIRVCKALLRTVFGIVQALYVLIY